MSALAAALRTVLADPNIGTAATYYPERGGVPGQSLRVMLRNPEDLMDLGQSTAAVPDVVLSFSAHDLCSVDLGGVFVVGDEEYEVMASVRGDRGLRLRVPCRRLTDGQRARRLLDQAAT